MRFEDIIRSLGSRRAAFEGILDFMDMPSGQLGLLGLEDLPVVQSTLPPQLYRWKKRKDIISRLLDAPDILALSEELGYSRATMEEWL